MEVASFSSWQDLPQELLLLVIELVDNPIDFLRFRSVCSHWRSSTSSTHCCLRFPLSLPYPIYDAEPFYSPVDIRGGHFSLRISSTVYLVQPAREVGPHQSQSWLIRVNQVENGKFLLLNPLSEDKPIRDLCPKFLNLLDCRVTQLSQSYKLQFIGEGDEFPCSTIGKWFKKVLFDGYVIFAIYRKKRLCFFRVKDDQFWTLIPNDRGFQYINIAIHKGRYYALEFTGTVTVIDSNFKIVSTIAPNFPPDFECHSIYLIESFGDLFLVVIPFSSRWSEIRHYNYVVYKLNEGDWEYWKKVNSLEGRTFFLSKTNGFSVLARDSPGCKENCIYYGKDNSTEFEYNKIGLYNMETSEYGSVADFPGYADVFWPPPPWLGDGAPSSGC